MKKPKIPKVLFRYDDFMEHVVIWSESGILLDDSLEGFPKLSGLDVLKNLAENGIINLEIEEIEDVKNEE